MAEGNSTCASRAGQIQVDGRRLKAIDLTGQRFGRWRVESREKSRNGALWNCVCECGTRKVIRGTALRYGSTGSCGCLKRDLLAEELAKHGMTDTPEYRAWAHLKDRCLNPQSKSYRNYGGRGIGVCQRWAESFEAFLADMGRRPGPGYEIDRVDVNGDYEPGNCRWITHKANNRNKRDNRKLTFNGRTLCVAEWAEATGIPAALISQRLSRKWTVERTLTTPVQSKG